MFIKNAAMWTIFFFFCTTHEKTFTTAYLNGDRARSKWPAVPQKNVIYLCVQAVLETGLHTKRGLSEMLVGWHHTVGGGARRLLGDRRQLLSKEMERVCAQGGGSKGGNRASGRRGNSERRGGKKKKKETVRTRS